MSDTEVDSLNTVAPLSFEEIIEAIRSSATQCEGTDDFIDFLTVLDVYLHDWNVYSVEERMKLMELLYELMSANKDLVREISWDLPALLLPFLDCDWPMPSMLKEARQVKLFYEVFNLLADHGSPKELLLTSCEILSDFKDPADDASDVSENEKRDDNHNHNTSPNSNTNGHHDRLVMITAVLKFHAVFQCIKFSFQRIETLYPSKFLGIITSAVLNFFTNSPNVSTKLSVHRTIYLFLRDYIPPEVSPDTIAQNDAEELTKVFEDEGYLQQKLLRLLFDVLVENLTASHSSHFIRSLVPSVNEGQIMDTRYDELMNRLVTLSYSLDLDLAEVLNAEITKSALLFDKNVQRLNSAEDIVKLVVAAYNNSSFREKDPISLPTSSSSVLILFVYAKYVDNMDMVLSKTIDTMSLIKFQVNLFIPFIINSKITNFAMLVYVITLTISKIENDTKIADEAELQKPFNKLLILTYLQNLSSLLTSGSSNYCKKFYLMFLKKFLQYLPEELSYEYLWDTINNCPFEECVLMNISAFSFLINNSKFDTELLTKDFKQLGLGKNASVSPPSLPERPLESKKFIDFGSERQAEFIKTVEQFLLELLIEGPDDKKRVDLLKLPKLISFVNVFLSFKFEDSKAVMRLFEDLNGKYLKDIDTEGEDHTLVQGLAKAIESVTQGIKIYSV